MALSAVADAPIRFSVADALVFTAVRSTQAEAGAGWRAAGG